MINVIYYNNVISKSSTVKRIIKKLPDEHTTIVLTSKLLKYLMHKYFKYRKTHPKVS